MTQNAIGIDIGGANLKLADTQKIARSRVFHLWKHPERLAAELIEFCHDLPPHTPIGITMTGELCDCFPTRIEGVAHIIGACVTAFPQRHLVFWSTQGRFLTVTDAHNHPLQVASANWLAQATFAARFTPDGLAFLVDMGSTTTDIVPILNGQPKPIGRTDYERLKSAELLYFGSQRTPLCAIEPTLAAEFFATMHDVNVFLRRMPEEPTNHFTADGRAMRRDEAWARLARMIGGDRDTVSEAEITTLCHALTYQLYHRLQAAILQAARAYPSQAFQLITSGAGEVMLTEFCEEFFPKVPRTSLAACWGHAQSTAACAYSVAKLLAEQAT